MSYIGNEPLQTLVLEQGATINEYRQEVIIASGITSVGVAFEVVPAYADVYLNGIKLSVSDYSWNIGVGQSTLTFTENPQTDDLVAIVSRDLNSVITTANTFSSINFSDSTQFSANGAEALTLLDGPGISLSSNTIDKSITVSSTIGQGAFTSVKFADSTQFEAIGSDALTFQDGKGITISSNSVAKTLTISADTLQVRDLADVNVNYDNLSNGQVLAWNGSQWEAASLSGTPSNTVLAYAIVLSG